MTAATRERRCDRCDCLPCQCPAVRRDDARKQREASERRTMDTTVPLVPAQFDGVCPICGGAITMGQYIGRTVAGSWAHGEYRDHDGEGMA